MNNLPKHQGAGPQRRGAQCSCIGCIGLRPALLAVSFLENLAAFSGRQIDVGFFYMESLMLLQVSSIELAQRLKKQWKAYAIGVIFLRESNFGTI